MMAVEGPFLAAIIARLADPEFNLAAHGVAFAFALLLESPVIMLMSASTALVQDATSYRRLRNFTHVLALGCTLLVPVLLFPPTYDALMQGLLALPPEVAGLTRGALMLLLPWPAAIGYRRFYQGILIRSGRTRAVAIGTVLRMVGMGTTGLTLFATVSWPGAWVGAASLSAGVCVEAVAARLMVAPTVAALVATDLDRAPAADAMGYRAIAAFYWPLVATSFIGLTVQPILTFFMGRASQPIASLAVFPVVHALSFVFRAIGLSYQEAAIALLGPRAQHLPEVRRFALWLGVAASVGLGLVAFSPLSTIWFQSVSGLSPELAAYARVPTMILVPFPALTVLLSFQRAALVTGRRTGFITHATVIEVVGVAALFAFFGWWLGLFGASAAFLAHLGGRLCGNFYLLRPVRRTLDRLRTPDAADGHVR